MKRLTDHLPIALLAVIAFAGSFSHLSDLSRRSGQHGWMAYATGVCVDLLAVVAAGEIRRDKRMKRSTRLASCVLAGAVVLTLAANLAEAQPTVWGRICAGIPAGAFLLATALLERRATEADRSTEEKYGHMRRPAAAASTRRITASPDVGAPRRPHRVQQPEDPTVSSQPVDLLARAREADREHRERTGRRITRDALRQVLSCSTGAATEMLRTLREEHKAVA